MRDETYSVEEEDAHFIHMKMEKETFSAYLCF
jgi:hypothetical protein